MRIFYSKVPDISIYLLQTHLNFSYPKILSAGGVTQNILRVIQWILQKPNSTVMLGSVANDEQGQQLKYLVNNDNVLTKYSIVPGHMTGLCIVLLNGRNYTLCSNSNASKYYKSLEIESDIDIINMLKKADIILVAAFFLTSRTDASEFLEQFSKEHNKIIALNLAADYTALQEPISIENYANICHILIGNLSEFQSLAKIMNIDNVETMVIKLSKSFTGYDTSNPLMRFGKIIVITNGSEPITYVIDGKVSTYEVHKMDDEYIVDKVAAGDAFEAGFLVALLKGHEIAKCLEWGCLAAVEIMKQPGCTIPNIQPEKVFR